MARVFHKKKTSATSPVVLSVVVFLATAGPTKLGNPSRWTISFCLSGTVYCLHFKNRASTQNSNIQCFFTLSSCICSDTQCYKLIRVRLLRMLRRGNPRKPRIRRCSFMNYSLPRWTSSFSVQIMTNGRTHSNYFPSFISVLLWFFKNYYC